MATAIAALKMKAKAPVKAPGLLSRVKLHNGTGAVRVVYEADGKASAIPPNGEKSVLLNSGAITMIRKGMDKGEKFVIVSEGSMDDLTYAEGKAPTSETPKKATKPVAQPTGTVTASMNNKPAPVAAPEATTPRRTPARARKSSAAPKKKASSRVRLKDDDE